MPLRIVIRVVIFRKLGAESFKPADRQSKHRDGGLQCEDDTIRGKADEEQRAPPNDQANSKGWP